MQAYHHILYPGILFLDGSDSDSRLCILKRDFSSFHWHQSILESDFHICAILKQRDCNDQLETIVQYSRRGILKLSRYFCFVK